MKTQTLLETVLQKKPYPERHQILCSEYYALDKPSAPKEAMDYYLTMAKKTGGPILDPIYSSSIVNVLSTKNLELP